MSVEPYSITGMNDIAKVEIFFTKLFVRVYFTSGRTMDMGFAQANAVIRHKGIPIIDWYAKLN